LHFEDIRRLLEVLHRLVDAGHTVLVIEHNLDVIQTADWIIDLGPEAGDGGGQVVACGPPEEIVRLFQSGSPTHTGRFLAEYLNSCSPQSSAGTTPTEVHSPAPQSPQSASPSPPRSARSRKTPPSFSVALDEPEAITANTTPQPGDKPSRSYSIERHMPWVRNAEAWHSGPKGFPAGQSRRWPGALLTTLLEHLRLLGGELLHLESQQTAILVSLSLSQDACAPWCRILTKQPEALVVECDLPASWLRNAAFRRWQSFAHPASTTGPVAPHKVTPSGPAPSPSQKMTTLRLALSAQEHLETTAVFDLLRVLYERITGSPATAHAPTPSTRHPLSTSR
jgi:hypothetical protein